MNRKPGDWDCTSCNHLNFSWREACQRCGDSKLAAGYGGKGEERHEYGRGGSEAFHGYGSSDSSVRGGESELLYGRNHGYYRSRSGFEDGYSSGYVAMDRRSFGADYRSSFAGDPRSRFGGVDYPRSGFSGNILGGHGIDGYRGDLRSGYERDYRSGFGSDHGGRYGNGYHGGYEGNYRGGNNYRNENNGGDYISKSIGGGDYNGRSYRGGSGYNGSEMRPGDWYCKENGCGAHNFASRISCFKCGISKDEKGNHGKSGYESRSMGLKGDPVHAGDGGDQPGWRPGDWMCSRSGCNEHNFGTRLQCFRCQAPRDA